MIRAAFFAMLGLAACTPAPRPTTTALTAGPDARAFGVAAYAAERDGAVLLDAYGVELGRFEISAPSADRRLIDFGFADGQTDEIEVYRPTADGRFLAPLSVGTRASAVVADHALRPLFATHSLVFQVADAARLARQTGLDGEDVAILTSCTTANSDTPVGCARPANTTAGCTNVSQLPAVMNWDYSTSIDWKEYQTYDECVAEQPTYAASCVHTSCDYIGGGTWGLFCTQHYSRNEWDASCPRQTCSTVGQYDKVPRYRECMDPGSCTKYQGTIGCTAYH